MSHDKVLILIRGLPGSGKSRFANVISENGKYPVIEIDDYFCDNQGTYSFRFDENHLAYKQCQDRTESSKIQGFSKIIVANTFTMEWEMEPYFRLAENFHYQTHVIVMENRHSGRNVHDIPEGQIQRMREKFRLEL